MVKLRAGKKKQAAVKDTAVVSSEFKKVHRLPSLPNINWALLRTKQGMAVAAGIILIIAALIAVITWRIKEANKPEVTKVVSQNQFIDDKLQGLKGSAPASSAGDDERVNYYEQLQNYSELKQDYQGALDAFLKRADIRSSDLDYKDYSRVARYYALVGDRQGSIAAIDKAISLLPKTSSDPGYNYDQMKELLERGKSL